MAIDPDAKIIFLHPNKCGGKSIELAFWGIEPKIGSADHHNVRHWIDELGEDFFNHYVFGFARNPWDRLVSIYHGRSQIINKISTPEFTWTSFEDFLDKVDTNNSPYKTQLSWFVNYADEVVVDFIGRFENYESDFDEVCDSIGAPLRKLPHVNASTHGPYWEYYTPETRDRVAELYKEDIEYFGYTFEESE